MDLTEEQKKQIEEFRRKLKSKGLDFGSWGDTEEKESVRHPMFDKQVEIYKKIVPLLQHQVDTDIEKIAKLQEVIERLKHGGGQ